MKLNCPHCGVKGSADDSYAGRRVKCPKCQGKFLVQPEKSLDLEEQLALSSALDETVERTESVDLADLLEQLPDESEIFPDIEPESGDLDIPSLEADIPELSDETVQELLPDEIEDLVEEEGEDQQTDDSELFEEMDIIDRLEDEEPSLEQEAELPEIPEEDETEVSEDEEEITDRLEDEEPPDMPDDIEQEAQVETADSHLADLTVPEQDSVEEEKEEEVEQEPYGVDKEQCWQCGKEGEDEQFTSRDGRLYCDDCLPTEEGEVHGDSDPDGMERAEDAATSLIDKLVEEDDPPEQEKLSLWGRIKGIFR